MFVDIGSYDSSNELTFVFDNVCFTFCFSMNGSSVFLNTRRDRGRSENYWGEVLRHDMMELQRI